MISRQQFSEMIDKFRESIPMRAMFDGIVTSYRDSDDEGFVEITVRIQKDAAWIDRQQQMRREMIEARCGGTRPGGR